MRHAADKENPHSPCSQAAGGATQKQDNDMLEGSTVIIFDKVIKKAIVYRGLCRDTSHSRGRWKREEI